MTEMKPIGVPRQLNVANWRDITRGKTASMLNAESRKAQIDKENERLEHERQLREMARLAKMPNPWGADRQRSTSTAGRPTLAAQIYARRNEGTAREVLDDQLGYRQLKRAN